MKRKINIILLIMCMISTSNPIEVYAQAEHGAMPMISMNFRGAELESILQLFSQQSGMNVIASEEVRHREVTIFLDNVTAKEALESILGATGLVYEAVSDGKILIVREPSILAEEDILEEEAPSTETHFYALNHALLSGSKGKPSGILEVVQGKLSEYGYIAVDERTNALIITDVPESFASIEDMIKNLDTPSPQVMIEAKIVETTLGDTENLGIEWTTKITATGSSRPHVFPYNAEGDHMLGVSGMNKYLPVGDDSTTTGAVSGEGTGSFTSDSSFSSATLPVFPYGGADMFTFGKLDFSQFSAIMEVLKSRTDTEVLSNPRIVTLNDQEATILVGETLGVPTFERNDTTGKFEITGYEEKDLGVKLVVTPHVNPQGFISVTLKPEISSLLGFDDLASDVKAPRYSTREAETEVRVKDGQTIAIGGLIKNTEIEYERKIPILGDLPIIGYFFKKTEKSIRKTELLIFVTVHLIKEDMIEEEGMPLKAKDEAVQIVEVTPASRREEIERAIADIRKK